jgi:hypothetical protein
MALALMGTDTIPERQKWLEQVSASDDQWIIERRAALAYDMGDTALARKILESTPFQMIHQRYVRTDLWKEIMKNEPGSGDMPPESLGEDDLARWGAYREYDFE